MSRKILIGCTNSKPVERQHGTVRVQVCTLEQHASCSEQGQQCKRMRPTCLAEECGMIGKKFIDTRRRHIYAEITEEDKKKIAQKLRTAYAQCHRVEITIKED